MSCDAAYFSLSLYNSKLNPRARHGVIEEQSGASVGIVNSEGEVPSDLAEEPAMKDLLLEQVKKQGN